MEEIKNLEAEMVQVQPDEEQSAFDFAAIYRSLILNWPWFVLSLIICMGLAALYLRYTTPTYQTYAKLLIKGDESKSSGRSLQGMTGVISNAAGIDNEMEILRSHTMATQVVRDLKLYTTYITEGRVKDGVRYKDQPVTVDIDAAGLDRLPAPITLEISREGDTYEVKGTYMVAGEDGAKGPFGINKKFNSLPFNIPTKAGNLVFTQNGNRVLGKGTNLKVTITPPKQAAFKYVGELSVAQTQKSTSICMLSMVDQIPARSSDYLKQLVDVYNRQANDDKNEVAHRTEAFINSRLEKINKELGKTEGEIQEFKEDNKMIQLSMSAGRSFSGQTEYEQRLTEFETQIALFNSLIDFMNESSSEFMVLPSNVGLSDGGVTQLIGKYNELVLERQRLLRTASENSPVVEPITEQIQNLNRDIRRGFVQSRKNLEIQRDAILKQLARYNTEVAETPQKERTLTEIGRQQEVKAGLYLMLLQKREENAISLAATANKGRLIDDPKQGGKVSPKSQMILLIGLLAGLIIPALLIIVSRFFRYRIEGHDDVVKLTRLPILADVAVASEKAKTKAGIVVQENKNNQMEEVFRSLRTNLQFMLKENEKTILFTSTTSGEGKTFNCANLAVSFALLGKKVILVGLDIRRPRLAELFEINDHKHGITNLLVKDHPTREDLLEQILPSGINDRLDLLMAGPVPPNPTELVARPSLEAIFKELRELYDYVLIDTAPVGLVTDTLQIGRIADTTVYICRADYTAKASFELINGLAIEKKLPKMALVLNGIDMSKKKYGYYYGYGRYGKYGRYGRYSYYGKYGRYGRYGNYGSYGSYGQYGNYGSYGNYSNSHYGNKKDDSIKR